MSIVKCSNQEVLVKFGPVVNTGQVPVPGSVSKETPVGRSKIKGPFLHTYDAITTVDIFDGPPFSLNPTKNGPVVLHFLPWHRTWSHSLITGGVFGILGGCIWGWKAGVVIPLAFGAHVLEDQLGHMGSNLFWPLTKKRFQGLGKMHAIDALPNFLAVWICCLFIFWDTYRVMEDPTHEFGLWTLLVYGIFIPLGCGLFLHRFLFRGKGPEKGGGRFCR
ncbi:MAG: hypothetical protein GKR87_00270 [Kiritimatiellae bacterium]|nr:hypothetical protein [Kiritimatiellia bacterium]